MEGNRRRYPTVIYHFHRLMPTPVHQCARVCVHAHTHTHIHAHVHTHTHTSQDYGSAFEDFSKVFEAQARSAQLHRQRDTNPERGILAS